MVLQPLAPRVEHHEPANRGTQPFGIRRDLEECRRRGLKQRSYTTRLLASARRASGSGIVKTMWT